MKDNCAVRKQYKSHPLPLTQTIIPVCAPSMQNNLKVFFILLHLKHNGFFILDQKDMSVCVM